MSDQNIFFEYCCEIILFVINEQDKSTDIEQQPPFGDRKDSKTLPQKRGIQNQREHRII